MTCLICDKDTKHQYQMEGHEVKVSYCKKHEIHVTTYVIQLVTDGTFDAEKWLKKMRQNESKTNKGGVPKKRK